MQCYRSTCVSAVISTTRMYTYGHIVIGAVWTFIDDNHSDHALRRLVRARITMDRTTRACNHLIKGMTLCISRFRCGCCSWRRRWKMEMDRGGGWRRTGNATSAGTVQTQVRRDGRSVRQHGQPSRTSQVAAVPVLTGSRTWTDETRPLCRSMQTERCHSSQRRVNVSFF